MKKRYYLAYGSNTNVRQMEHRCPTAKAVGMAKIADHRLVFKGSKTGAYFTIEPQKERDVPVVVWEVLENDERSLDVYEGYPVFYYKRMLEVEMECMETKEMRKVNAFVYIMDEKRSYGIPTRNYVQGCAEGYKSFGIDLDYINQALKDTEQEIRLCERAR